MIYIAGYPGLLWMCPALGIHQAWWCQNMNQNGYSEWYRCFTSARLVMFKSISWRHQFYSAHGFHRSLYLLILNFELHYNMCMHMESPSSLLIRMANAKQARVTWAWLRPHQPELGQVCGTVPRHRLQHLAHAELRWTIVGIKGLHVDWLDHSVRCLCFSYFISYFQISQPGMHGLPWMLILYMLQIVYPTDWSFIGRVKLEVWSFWSIGIWEETWIET